MQKSPKMTKISYKSPPKKPNNDDSMDSINEDAGSVGDNDRHPIDTISF